MSELALQLRNIPEEENFLNEAIFSVKTPKKVMDKHLSDSIDTTIEKANKFYALIYNVKNFEEKILDKFYILGCDLFGLKKEYKNNGVINDKINEMNSLKNDINNILIKIRDKYMQNEILKSIEICSEIKARISIFFIISILHYLAMTEVEGILFSIFGEIKKINTFKKKKNMIQIKHFTTS